MGKQKLGQYNRRGGGGGGKPLNWGWGSAHCCSDVEPSLRSHIFNYCRMRISLREVGLPRDGENICGKKWEGKLMTYLKAGYRPSENGRQWKKTFLVKGRPEQYLKKFSFPQRSLWHIYDFVLRPCIANYDVLSKIICTFTYKFSKPIYTKKKLFCFALKSVFMYWFLK